MMPISRQAPQKKARRAGRPAHTPGDWTYDEGPDGHIYIAPVGDPCLYIADILGPKEDPGGRYSSRRRRLANARLLAAAPRLLRACQKVVAEGDRNLTAAALACAEAVEDAIGRA